MCSQGAEVACLLVAYAWCESCALFALRAVDPCAPLGVLECARWALSERARDGLCLVGMLAYALAWASARGLRMYARHQRAEPASPAARGPGAAHPHPLQFWLTYPHPETYYVLRVKRGRLTCI